MHLKGIIFDLDGTLADTLPVCIAAFRATILAFTGREYSDAEVNALFGPNEEGILRRVVPADRWEASVEEYVRQYEAHHARCSAPFEGVLPLLDTLREHGVRVAIVTGKGPRSAEVSLRRLGLGVHFDTVATGSPEGSIKPEAIRKIVASWGVEPSETATRIAYVGDSPSDMNDARKAGVIPIAAAWASTADPAMLAAREPAALFRTVDEFTRWITSSCC
jgi:phosphoglycolate phosphatase-like HAD superfamily hydrolase